MIETPLARLDASHRHDIVENFLPLAFHLHYEIIPVRRGKSKTNITAARKMRKII